MPHTLFQTMHEPTPTQRLVGSLTGWALYGICAVAWGAFVGLHFQSVYAALLPVMGGWLSLIFFALPSLALALGHISQEMQIGDAKEIGIKEMALLTGLAALLLPVLLIVDAIGRGLFGGSFYPSLRVYFTYPQIMSEERQMRDQAAGSPEHKSLREALAGPTYQSTNAVHIASMRRLRGEKFERAMGFGELFGAVKATPEFNLADRRGFMDERDLLAWRDALRANPPEEIKLSPIHRAAWLRIMGEVRMDKPIEDASGDVE